jgi:hypothetical protein
MGDNTLGRVCEPFKLVDDTRRLPEFSAISTLSVTRCGFFVVECFPLKVSLTIRPNALNLRAHVQREGIALGSLRAETFSKTGGQGSLAQVTRENLACFPANNRIDGSSEKVK